MSNEAELLKNKENYDPSKLSDKVLLDDHRIVHAWASRVKKGKKIKGWSWEDIWNAHRLIAQEIIRRGFKHDTPLKRKLEAKLKYSQPHPAWKRDGKDGIKGPTIFLPSILKAFDGDFMICEDFVTIVGGLCNHGKTKGDIDILIKCKEPEDSSPLGMATKFRIARALAKINIPEDRIQFLYDNFSGPFTSHVHCYDLVLKLKDSRVLHEMAAIKQSSVSPFSFVIQPKPLHGRFKGEIYSPETVVEVIENLRGWKDSLERGLFVEQKFDGVRWQFHKVGKKIIIWTEEKTDVTNNLPSLVKAFQKINHNFVAEGELELWKDNKHQNRADTAAVIHTKKVSPFEPGIIVNLYDLLWIDGNDIHDLPFKERSKILRSKFLTTKKIKVSVPKLVKTLDDLKREVIKASKQPGSEGAMIKMIDYRYPLKPHTSQMLKFKNEFSIDVQVVEVHDVKGTKSKNYLTAVRSGAKLIPAGRTYNTNILANVGDKIRVVFVELSKYIDPETKEVWFNFWSPRVVGKASKTDTVQTAEKLVEKSGGQVAVKKFPTRYKNLLEEDDYFEEFKKNALLWDTEEFDFGLSNGWITPSLVPKKLSQGRSEIRNSKDYILKKQNKDKAIIRFRGKNNEIKTEKIVSLVEV